MEEPFIDNKKQPFNERLVEMIKGQRPNVFSYLFSAHNDSVPKRSICMQYNFKQKPRTSYGIALYDTSTNKWYVIQPKFTIEMRSIIFGMYNESLLPFLLEQLYDDELDLLINHASNFRELYKLVNGAYPSCEIYESIFKDNNDVIHRLCLRLKHIRHQRLICQYIYPKGRPLTNELIFQTAKRELEEETNVKIVFHGNYLTEKNLSKGSLIHSIIQQNTKSTHWEPCDLQIPLNNGGYLTLSANICREYVSHLHSDITGKIYKTTVWICAFDSGGNDIESMQASVKNGESRGGVWLSSEELVKKARVVELFLKTEMTLNKYIPYLTI